MDNVTHTLTGLMLSRAGLNRISPQATGILLLAANAPDIDVVSGFGGSVNYLHYHRGLTHSLVMMPILALLPVLVLRFATRKPIIWKTAWLVSLIGVASHVLMDWTNVYGVRLLLPFSGEWFNADITSIIDVWIWLALLLGLIGPFLSRLVSSEIGAKPSTGRGMAIFVVGFLLFYSFGRYVLHQRAVATLDSRLYQSEVPLRVAAIPTPANPLRWTGLVEGREFYEVHQGMNLLRQFDPTAGKVFYKLEPSPPVAAARTTETFRVFLAFSQWPLWRATPLPLPENGILVEAMDLRFGAPPHPRFVASAILNGSLHVEKAWFEFGAPPEYSAGLK
jgi:inner membrane protein